MSKTINDFLPKALRYAIESIASPNAKVGDTNMDINIIGVAKNDEGEDIVVGGGKVNCFTCDKLRFDDNNFITSHRLSAKGDYLVPIEGSVRTDLGYSNK
jgi:hypothetical protein